MSLSGIIDCNEHTRIYQEISSKLPCGGQKIAFTSQIPVYTESDFQTFIFRHWPVGGTETTFLRAVAKAGPGSTQLDRHSRPWKTESLVQGIKTISNCISRALSICRTRDIDSITNKEMMNYTFG